MSRWLALSIVLISALPACGPSPDDPWLHDNQGRAVLYHGVNLASYAKYAPDFLPWQTPEELARMKDWGFNLVRYLVFWEAIEPEDGRFDDAYIEKVVEQFQWLEALGVDVLVDLHQDLYARRFTGDGFPEWTIHDRGLSFTARQPWNLDYLEPAVLASFDYFWHDAALKARYVAMVDHLLSRIDALPNVIGLDVMNEPWPWLGLGFEQDALTPFYNRIQAMKREKGYRTPLYFEAVIFTSTDIPTRLRFKPDQDDAYSVHYYDPFCHEGQPYRPWNQWLMGVAVRMKASESRRFGVPFVCTEFGIAPSTGGYDRYLDDFVGWMDEYHASWTYYSYDKASDDGFGILDESGNPSAILPHLIEAYPQRIAGTAIRYVREERAFDLRYAPLDSPAPTVIFIPRDLANVHVEINEAPVPFDQYLSHATRPEDGPQHIRVTW